MRISDWSSDVCSSDLVKVKGKNGEKISIGDRVKITGKLSSNDSYCSLNVQEIEKLEGDRKSVVEGKSVSVRVDLGGRRIIKKKKQETSNQRREQVQISDYNYRRNKYH